MIIFLNLQLQEQEVTDLSSGNKGTKKYKKVLFCRQIRELKQVDVDAKNH